MIDDKYMINETEKYRIEVYVLNYLILFPIFNLFIIILQKNLKYIR